MGEGNNDDAGQTKEISQDDPVKERCWEQREALPGEPRCAICSRYGEYICDQTDDDVCSTECKALLLHRLDQQQQQQQRRRKSLLKTRASIKIAGEDDECFYVRDEESTVPAPVTSFSWLDLPRRLRRNLELEGYETPTPVQMQVIPAALAKRNLLVTAETGSGKTAAYLIPIIARRESIVVGVKGPYALVLAPTRELCVQIEERAKALAKGLPFFKTALVVGGDTKPGQVYRVGRGVELIVATPGRLIDLLSNEKFELDRVSVFVLDEVDCMFQSGGFRDQVLQIYTALSNPQVLMFSATISISVEKVANSLSNNSNSNSNSNSKLELISVAATARVTRVKQVVIWVESNHKKRKLIEIFKSKQHFNPPVVVFVGSRMGAELLAEAITVSTGMRALSIHGEKGMQERREILRVLSTGEVAVIVATGILGRGMELANVKQVILFDMPKSMAEYTHQIGRASDGGTAIVFVNGEDSRLFKELVRSLRSSGSTIPRELVNWSHPPPPPPPPPPPGHSMKKKMKFHA